MFLHLESQEFHQNCELVRQFGPKVPLRRWTPPDGDTIEVFFNRGGRTLQGWRDTAVAPARAPWPNHIAKVPQPLVRAARHSEVDIRPTADSWTTPPADDWVSDEI
jgi:hypothetical protein